MQTIIDRLQKRETLVPKDKTTLHDDNSNRRKWKTKQKQWREKHHHQNASDNNRHVSQYKVVYPDGVNVRTGTKLSSDRIRTLRQGEVFEAWEDTRFMNSKGHIRIQLKTKNHHHHQQQQQQQQQQQWTSIQGKDGQLFVIQMAAEDARKTKINSMPHRENLDLYTLAQHVCVLEARSLCASLIFHCPPAAPPAVAPPPPAPPAAAGNFTIFTNFC